MTNKRTDGYHNLETIFFPLGLHDALEVVPAQQDGCLYISGLEVPGEAGSNLVDKACKIIKREFPHVEQHADMYLHKAIPMGAGLGGGSADGAFALKLLNDFYGLNLDEGQLLKYALELGSDCPFFIKNRPQLAKGRGEIMTDIGIDLGGYSIQVICPDVHVSTAKAFAMLEPKAADYDLTKLGGVPVKDWKELVSNDFEQPVFAQHPELEKIKQQLYTHGALYASMSGSGSAIYGLFLKGKRAVIDTELKYENFYIE